MEVSLDKRLGGILSGVSVTFSSNMDQPFHRWYRFPAGFSADLVRSMIQTLDVDRKSIVLDPFTGCGTTNVVCKTMNIESVGVEAHPLLSWIAKVKVYWDFSLYDLKRYLNNKCNEVDKQLKTLDSRDYDLVSKPEFLHKCYSEETLARLYALKALIEDEEDHHLRELMLLGLLSILRKVTTVATGWSYTLPKHKKKNSVPPVSKAFKDQMWMMYEDLRTAILSTKDTAMAEIYERSDARDLKGLLDNREIDFEFTSPPYLNNYDYAERTRLDLYFLGWANSWGEITEKVRNKLIISATTQIKRSEMRNIEPRTELPLQVREELFKKMHKLSEERLQHGGKKDYDFMVVGYFNDMYDAISEMHRVLKPRKYAVMILGDSAPYGVHIPTDVYLAIIGKEVGFNINKIYVLRERGGKWAGIRGGRRHEVPLRESLILFKK